MTGSGSTVRRLLGLDDPNRSSNDWPDRAVGTVLRQLADRLTEVVACDVDTNDLGIAEGFGA
jgi:hypothetical protein